MVRRRTRHEHLWIIRRGGAVDGLVQLATVATTLGILQNGMSQLLKGQNPTTQWEQQPTAALGAAMLRGGSFGILGDFMFSGMNRFGSTPTEYLAGPSADLLNSAVLIPMQLRRGQPVGGDILKIQVRSHLPLPNLVYTKIARDYLVWNSLTGLGTPRLQRTRLHRKLMNKTKGSSIFTTRQFSTRRLRRRF